MSFGSSHQVHQTVKHFKAGKAHFFKQNPISNKGDQGEAVGDVTFIADLVMGAIMSWRNSMVYVVG